MLSTASILFRENNTINVQHYHSFTLSIVSVGRHGHDHMVVGFTTTYVISAYHH